MKLIGRRDFLAAMGLGPGAHLLGSIFKSSLLPQAMGAVPRRKNFIFLSGYQGFIEAAYTCEARKEDDFDLTSFLEPLAPFKKDLVIASNFFNPHGIIDQHGNGYAYLTAMPGTPGMDVPGGISIDRLIGKKMGMGDPFPSLVVKGGKEGGTFAADGPKAPTVAINGPVEFYSKVFLGGVPNSLVSPADAAKVRAQRVSALAFIAGDVKKMSRRLAGPEREKLDQYLTSLQAVEKQLADPSKPVLSACQRPGAPDPKEPQFAITKGTNDCIRPKEMAVITDLVFHAHLCGLTRVSHFSVGAGGHPNYNILDPNDKAVILGEDGTPATWDGHEIHHRDDRVRLTKMYHYQLGFMAMLADKLSKTPDPSGMGTMLDNSLLVYMNAYGGQHHYGTDTFAALMLGKAGGSVRTGRYVRYPTGKLFAGDLFTSMANAVLDTPIDKFGDTGLCKGPAPGLL